jgi:hypothetical protein
MAGNRFYIEPQQNNNLMNLANIGARLYMGSQENERGLARERLMAEDLALKGRASDLETAKSVSMFGGSMPDPSNPEGPRLTIPRDQGTEIMKAQAVKQTSQDASSKQAFEMPSTKPFGQMEALYPLEQQVQKAFSEGVDPDGIKIIRGAWEKGPMKILDSVIQDPNLKKGDALDRIITPVTYNALYDGMPTSI